MSEKKYVTTDKMITRGSLYELRGAYLTKCWVDFDHLFRIYKWNEVIPYILPSGPYDASRGVQLYRWLQEHPLMLEWMVRTGFLAEEGGDDVPLYYKFGRLIDIYGVTYQLVRYTDYINDVRICKCLLVGVATGVCASTVSSSNRSGVTLDELSNLVLPFFPNGITNTVKVSGRIVIT